MRTFVKITSSFLILFLCTACSFKKQYNEIEIKDINSQALSPSIKWAVITEPYVSILTDADDEAEIKSHGRRGDVFCITGVKIVNTEHWYQIDGGFLKENNLKIYDNKYRAEKEGQLLLK